MRVQVEVFLDLACRVSWLFHTTSKFASRLRLGQFRKAVAHTRKGRKQAQFSGYAVVKF